MTQTGERKVPGETPKLPTRGRCISSSAAIRAPVHARYFWAASLSRRPGLTSHSSWGGVIVSLMAPPWSAAGGEWREEVAEHGADLTKLVCWISSHMHLPGLESCSFEFYFCCWIFCLKSDHEATCLFSLKLFFRLLCIVARCRDPGLPLWLS